MRARYCGRVVEVVNARYNAEYCVIIATIEDIDGRVCVPDWALEPVYDEQWSALSAYIDSFAQVPECFRQYINTLEMD